jgi:hypothetical protein
VEVEKVEDGATVVLGVSTAVVEGCEVVETTIVVGITTVGVCTEVGV